MLREFFLEISYGAAHGISAQVFFPTLKMAIENYGISRKKCSSPVDPHVEDLGSSSLS